MPTACRSPLTAVQARVARKPLLLRCIDSSKYAFGVCAENATYYLSSLTEWDSDGLFVGCFLRETHGAVDRLLCAPPLLIDDLASIFTPATIDVPSCATLSAQALWSPRSTMAPAARDTLFFYAGRIHPNLHHARYLTYYEGPHTPFVRAQVLQHVAAPGFKVYNSFPNATVLRLRAEARRLRLPPPRLEAQRINAVEWMRRSVFCWVPPGQRYGDAQARLYWGGCFTDDTITVVLGALRAALIARDISELNDSVGVWLAALHKCPLGTVAAHIGGLFLPNAAIGTISLAKRVRALHSCRSMIEGSLSCDAFESAQGLLGHVVDILALRVGAEKGEDEADTVGCCSLRKEHFSFEPGPESPHPSDMCFTLDFLGKDISESLVGILCQWLVYGKRTGRGMLDAVGEVSVRSQSSFDFLLGRHSAKFHLKLGADETFLAFALRNVVRNGNRTGHLPNQPLNSLTDPPSGVGT